MSNDPQTHLLTKPKGVDVVAIEAELTQLWKAAAEGNTASTRIPVMRACSLNLIVVADDERQLDEIGNMIGEVTLEHPARIFLIAADRTAAVARLEAWISARCSLPVPGGKQVCCEQITLSAASEEEHKIPSIVTSLLVPDVPGVVLWKSAVRPKDPLLESLAGVVNRVIIDSSNAPQPEAMVRAWGSFFHQAGPHVSFGDLAWTHVTPWRAVIANAFNPEAMRPLLHEITRVDIAYSTTVQPRRSGLSQALLLGAWLTERLHWEVTLPMKSVEGGRMSAGLQTMEDTVKRGIMLNLYPAAARAGFQGGIEFVTIAAGETSVELSATSYPQCVAVTRRTLSGAIQEMVPVITEKSEAMLIAQELEVTAHDKGYEAVMNKVLQIIGQ